MNKTAVSFSALIVATIIAVLDISAVNLALPTIANDLGLPIAEVLWLSKANLLACAVAILPIAAVGDVLGHKRNLCMGLLVMALTSAGCALVSDLCLLISLRTVQGVAGAAIMCSTLVLLREIFPPEKLGTALGLNALFVAIATTSAPAISGLILSYASWRWLFVMAPVLAVFALIIVCGWVPEKRQSGSRFDWLGSALLTLIAVSLLLVYLGVLPSVSLLGAALLLWFFIAQQKRNRWAVLPVGIFKNLRFDYSLASSMAAFVAQSAVFIALPIVLQSGLGHDPLMAALLFLPWPLATAIAGPWAGRQADKSAPRKVATLGILVFSLGLAALAVLPEAATAWDLIWRTALCGLGFGLFQSPNNREILTNVDPSATARASALLSAARILGQALGAVLVGWYLSDSQNALGQTPPISALFWWVFGLQWVVLGAGLALYLKLKKTKARLASV